MKLAVSLDHDSLYAIGETESDAMVTMVKATRAAIKRGAIQSDGMNAAQWLEYVGVNVFDIGETGAVWSSGHVAPLK